MAEAKLAKVAAKKDDCVAEVEAAERRLGSLRVSAPVPMQHDPTEAVLLQSRRINSRSFSEPDTEVPAQFLPSGPRSYTCCGCRQFGTRTHHVQGRGCSTSSSSRPVRVEVHFDRPRRYRGARERCEPVQPAEAVTRVSSYGLWASRVGEASHPGPPKDRRFPNRRARFHVNRFVVLFSDDEEEWVLSTALASSAAVRRAQ